MKIYTKTGDDGTTALFDGTRVSKDHPRIDVYGAIDELDSMIGLAMSFMPNSNLQTDLSQVQRDLLALGANLANPDELKQKDKSHFAADKISGLEGKIDRLDAQLPPLKAFILPGGSSAAGALQVARCICRRAERKLTALSASNKINPVFLIYLNRLSDYLFMAARGANQSGGIKEAIW